MGLEGTADLFTASQSPALSSMLAPGIAYDAVETAFIGCVFSASTCGQAALYQLSFTGILVMNVNNNCGMGSTALALGFERMAAPGSIGTEKNDAWHDRPGPIALLMQAAVYASPDAHHRCPHCVYLGLSLRSILGCMGRCEMFG